MLNFCPCNKNGTQAPSKRNQPSNVLSFPNSRNDSSPAPRSCCNVRFFISTTGTQTLPKNQGRPLTIKAPTYQVCWMFGHGDDHKHGRTMLGTSTFDTYRVFKNLGTLCIPDWKLTLMSLQADQINICTIVDWLYLISSEGDFIQVVARHCQGLHSCLVSPCFSNHGGKLQKWKCGRNKKKPWKQSIDYRPAPLVSVLPMERTSCPGQSERSFG